MKIARREFLSLYILLAATYLFGRVFLLEPLLVSSAWIALGGALLASLPVLVCARLMMGAPDPLDRAFEATLGRAGARVWYGAALLLVLVQTHSVSRTFTASVLTYTADMVYDRSVAVITLVAAGLGAYVGRLAIAGCARVTLRLLAIVLGVLALSALGDVHAEHFFPLLGPGADEQLSCVLPLAGILITPLLLLLRADTCDGGFRRALPLGACAAALSAAVCLALYTLATPTLPAMPTTLSFRTSQLIFSGGGIQLQLPLIIAWNACQLLLIASLLSMGGDLLRRIVPRVGRQGVPIVTALELAAGMLSVRDELALRIADMAAYPVIALGFVLAAALYALRRRGHAAHGRC